MKIKTKLILALSIFVTSIGISGGYAIISNNTEQKAYSKMIDDAQVRYTLRSIQFRMAGYSNDERAFLLNGKEEYAEGMKKKAEDIASFISKLKAMTDISDKEKEAIAKLDSNYQVFLDASNRVAESYRQGNKEEAMNIHFGEEREARKELDPIIQTYLDEINKELEEDKLARKENLQIGLTIQIGMISAMILFAILYGGALVRSITRPIYLVNHQLKDIADGEGDLTKTITLQSKDELSELASNFNRMVDKIRQLIYEVRHNTELVAASAEELAASAEETSKGTELISNTIQKVANGTEKQVQSIEESSHAVNEMSIGVKQIADHSSDVSNIAINTSEMAVEGNETLRLAVSQMKSISQTINDLSSVVKGLGERSQEIGQIVEVITSIAGQTNLLALNAAIEAARAGEHGRGFAIVADEVRKLAEQSSSSAQQITELINGIQLETTKAVTSMEVGTKEVAEGIDIVSNAGEMFDRIQQSINQVASQILEVSTASQQMSSSTLQVVQSMKVIEDVSNEAAAGTQSISAASEEQLASMVEVFASAANLSKMAEDLQRIIGKFKV